MGREIKRRVGINGVQRRDDYEIIFGIIKEM